MNIFSTIILIFLFAFSLYAQKQVEVMVTSTNLRSAPDSASEKVQTVQKGEKLILERKQEKNGWYYVSSADNTLKGWIRKDTVNISAITNKPVSEPSVKVTPVSNPIKEITNTQIKTPSISPIPSVTETPVQSEEVIRIETEEVTLNVRVVDSNNRAITNLNQAQFKVFEDDILQPIISLNTTEVPVITALVIDNSRSLRPQLQNIIEAGKTIVSANRPADESTIIRFITSDKIEVVKDFTVNKHSLIEGLNNLFVEGGQTAIIDAVYFAAKKVEQYKNRDEKADKISALILVSDGDDRSSSQNEEQLFEFLRKSQIQIHAIGFINNLSNQNDAVGINRQAKAKAFLTRLAEETGGNVYFPNSINELPQIASKISMELHTQYLISYAPTNEKRDGTLRKIKVVIEDEENKEKKIAITRSGRIAEIIR